VEQESQAELPNPVAEIALHALDAAAHRIEKQFGSASLNEGLEADMLNDLGYIRAIATTLHREGIKR
jgi:hypothetical protein